ncbi:MULTISPECIES: LysR substrate-binding domain-containing protein [unclassified Amycolatopsis]|uniref:LysR substrate-binding domain-containing protein n=1 Tax=unclassified Amycolatopsis TaxID=2618356 RepID=UPI0028762584|nr:MULTISPECIES: LysR substrate-binding domain-containing protein [unclassified Amycolatopsis]MDS0135486.1 LysR family transcriptional regulator [Amycolatopsis sp. 505]MDS0140823.1 LysR family transcriptional regulator [Amycolatopsis sp. CM201R]
MDHLRSLRYFLVVAEELHFGRAAERLGMAQPPLSQRIRRLETELGARLFERGRRVTLTEAGEVLRAEARDLLSRWDRMTALVAKAERGELDSLRAGVPPDLPGRVLAAILTKFAEQCPAVRLDLQELTTAEQARLLADRALDAGLLQLPVDAAGLELGPVVDTPLGVLLPRDSPLALRARLTLADLAGEGLVHAPRAAAPGSYDTLLRTCWDHGFRPAAIRHARNPEFVLGLVLAGHGVAFEPGARKEPRVVWRPLEGEVLRTRMAFAWPSTTPHPQAAKLAEVAAEVLQHDGVSRPAPEPQAARPWDVFYERS